MRTLSYAAEVQEPEAGSFLVTFPDVPEAISQGGSLDDALSNATDALSVALEVYLDLGREWPEAVAKPDGRRLHEVAVSPALAARAVLVREMARQRLTNVALARIIGKDEKVVRRIVSGKSASFDQTILALRAVGVRPGLSA